MTQPASFVGIDVAVVYMGQIHVFGKRDLSRAKTDKVDARLIAHYCRVHCPTPCASYCKSPSARSNRENRSSLNLKLPN